MFRRRQWQATPVLLPRKSHGRRSLVGCSPWGRYKLDATERLHFDFSLSHNGEGNGNPLQCSCLENPRDGRAWWAAVYGVAQSWTRLKRLSSSSSSSSLFVQSPLYILDAKQLNMWFANILYHFVGCLFIFWIMFFDAQRVYFWSSVYLFFGGGCCSSFWCQRIHI